jgi:glycerate 2-kinase
MVNVLVAPDKFKGSLTAREVCDAVNQFFAADKKYAVSMLPLADGGEGTFEILLNHFKGVSQQVVVHDPLMRKITATYGLSHDGKTAFIEMAKASGLQLLSNEERNPLITTTFGTGELIAHALHKKVSAIILGIGGSATNDAGTGMASALGYNFFHHVNNRLEVLNGQVLNNIVTIDRTTVNPLLEKVRVTTLCDVNNPLTGPNGAANVFAPQKGATPSQVRTLELAMISFERLLKTKFGFSSGFNGAGAAGGLGAGARFFLNASMTKGIDYISDATSLEQKVMASDLIITGEGKLDSQSLSGKVVQRVSDLAKKHNKKVIVLCGVLELTPQQLENLGIDECLVLSRGEELKNAMRNADTLIKRRRTQSKLLQTL